jgi:hypothetical protein
MSRLAAGFRSACRHGSRDRELKRRAGQTRAIRFPRDVRVQQPTQCFGVPRFGFDGTQDRSAERDFLLRREFPISRSQLTL